ncbi:MAG: choline TMA-lyase-activating enzyme [Desulfobacteraceae bacterium 4572_89]|nr:MAG: choline TMA-lyase-activating enzyme [Desulfobacteraceae bacterium 4572_89]
MADTTIERKARIFNIQKYNMYDGPGVRTIVFFKGCPLHCQWCSNPESQQSGPQVLFKQDLCVSCGACVPVCPVGIHKISPVSQVHEIVRDIDCTGCRKCEEACPSSALSIVGESKTISELMDVIEEDRAFYDVSGGGVTLSGGEALMQPEAAANLLSVCKQRGIGTAVETCGYANPKALMKIAEFTDLFLFDLKHMDSDRHVELTGVRNESILNNLTALLNNRHQVKVRMPLLKSVNDCRQDIDTLMDFLAPFRNYKNFQGIDLLPYHKLGVNKYTQLGLEYAVKGDPSLSDEDLDRIEAWIKEYDFPVSVIRH